MAIIDDLITDSSSDVAAIEQSINESLRQVTSQDSGNDVVNDNVRADARKRVQLILASASTLSSRAVLVITTPPVAPTFTESIHLDDLVASHRTNRTLSVRIVDNKITLVLEGVGP